MAAPEMLARLEQLATEIGALHSKLILLVGAPHSGKTALLAAFAGRVEASTLNVGSERGRRLAVIPQKQRHLQAGTELRELADEHAKSDLLLMDNIELLFDTTLQLNPLDFLKRYAHSRRVVAVWPERVAGRAVGLGRHGTFRTSGLRHGWLGRTGNAVTGDPKPASACQIQR
jgi:ATPase subunit of ABC transporter with duplicated ATPase domains